MFRRTSLALCVVSLTGLSAQAADVASGGFAVASDIYIGGAYAHSWTDIDTSGLNTLGPHVNFDCAGVTVGTLTCDDTASVSGGSFLLGLTNIYNFSSVVSLRGEVEYNYQSGADYVTGSFPGAPTPAFVYATSVSEHHTGFANAYLDVSMPNMPLTIYAGGGIGVSQASVTTNDTVVTGTGSNTSFAWNAGVGAKYAVTNRIDVFGDVRYLDLGSTNVSLVAGGGGPAGNYVVDHRATQVRVGLTIKLGEVRLPWNN